VSSRRGEKTFDYENAHFDFLGWYLNEIKY
jgi:hypothetical protein